MVRFLLIHYLAIYTALVPAICCCNASPNAKVAGPDNSSQSESTCCQKRHTQSQSHTHKSPVNGSQKECPCTACKVFLPTIHSLNQNDNLFSDDCRFENRALEAALFTLEVQSNLDQHSALSGFLNSSCRSSVEILRAKCVLRC